MHPWLQDYLGSWSILALKAFLYYGTAISIFYFCRTLKKTGQWLYQYIRSFFNAKKYLSSKLESHYKE